MRTHDDASHVPPTRHTDAPSYRRVDRADAREPVYEEPAYDEAVTDRQVTTRYLESLPARVNAVLFALLAALEGLLALRSLQTLVMGNLQPEIVLPGKAPVTALTALAQPSLHCRQLWRHVPGCLRAVELCSQPAGQQRGGTENLP